MAALLHDLGLCLQIFLQALACWKEVHVWKKGVQLIASPETSASTKGSDTVLDTVKSVPPLCLTFLHRNRACGIVRQTAPTQHRRV